MPDDGPLEPETPPLLTEPPELDGLAESASSAFLSSKTSSAALFAISFKSIPIFSMALSISDIVIVEASPSLPIMLAKNSFASASESLPSPSESAAFWTSSISKNVFKISFNAFC